jgi:hypothetical protein
MLAASFEKRTLHNRILMNSARWEWAGPILNLHDNIFLKDTEVIISQGVSRKEGIYSIQFWGAFPIRDETLELINDGILTRFPDCGFRLRDDYPLSPALPNLNLLEKLTNLTFLRCEINPKISLKPLLKLPKLRKLIVMSEKPIAISEIVTMKTITDLTLSGKIKDIDKIAAMTNLVRLEIWRQTLSNLEFLEPLSNLKELSFVLGGTRNLESIAQIGHIEKLSFTWVRDLEMHNLLPINEMTTLKELHFEKLPKLTNLNWLANKKVKVKVVDCKNFNQASS